MTCKFLPTWVVIGALLLANQTIGHDATAAPVGVNAQPPFTGETRPDPSLHTVALPQPPASVTSANADLSIPIPNLLASAGVTLSGMDLATNCVEESPQIKESKALVLKTLTPEVEATFTLPPFTLTKHYLNRDRVNLIKLPIAWENLEEAPLSGKLNRTRLEIFTDVVATITNQNSSVIVTLATSLERFANFSSKETLQLDQIGSTHHNLTEEATLSAHLTRKAFLHLWGRLAKHFQNDRRVIFNLMEIPHNGVLPKDWESTIQAAVNKIRKVGARNQIILPSLAAPRNATTFSTFKHFPENFKAMKDIKNPDGSHDGILFDLSQTLGPKRHGSDRCGGVDVEAIVQPAVELLKQNKRQAIVGTLAAGSEESCTRSLAKFAKKIAHSYPYLAGFVLLGAGAFDETSPWILTKEGKFSQDNCSEEWVDQPNFKSVQRYFPRKKATTVASSDKN